MMHRPMIIDRQRGRVVVPRGNVRLGFDASDWGRYDGRYVARTEHNPTPANITYSEPAEPPEKSGGNWGWILLAIFTGILALPVLVWLLLRAVENFQHDQ